jgi:hypothetical protein
MGRGRAGVESRQGLVSSRGKAWCRVEARPGVESRQGLVSSRGKAWCRVEARPGVESMNTMKFLEIVRHTHVLNFYTLT